jgi:hypothetical protein
LEISERPFLLAGDTSDLGEDIFELAVIGPHEGDALEAGAGGSSNGE